MTYQAANYQEQKADYPGIGRLKYYLYHFLITLFVGAIFAIIMLGGLFGTATIAEHAKNSDAAGLTAIIGIISTYFAGIFIPIFLWFLLIILNDIRRMQNTGASAWLLLLYFIPIVNLWVWWRLCCCPEGYEDHKKLDLWGKFLTFLVIIMPFALILTAMLLASQTEFESSGSQSKEFIIEDNTQEESLLTE